MKKTRTSPATNSMLALVMAGGSGTRLWPVSRQKTPKQMLKLIGDKTLLQHTFRRLSKGFSAERIFIATTGEYSKYISRQLPQIPKTNFSIEPSVKDRGPAIALAVLLMHHHNPNSSFVTAWSDHLIKDERAYFNILKNAEKYLEVDPSVFITIGVKPKYPHTGLGYIEQGSAIKSPGKINIRQVKKYKEKPDLKTAQQFVRSGKFLWNTGYFICKTATLLSLYKKHLPEIYDLLMKIKPALGTKKQQAIINKFYALMPKVDIEKGLIEKLSNVAVLPATFDWADIGSWKIIKDVQSKDEDNLILGNVEVLNTAGSLIYNYEPKLVTLTGLKDMIVVNTKDALLVADKNNSEQIKLLVEKMKKDKKLQKYL